MTSAVAVSLGCPAGIGPEVAVRAAARLDQPDARVLLVGDMAVVRAAARVRRVAQKRLVDVASRAELDGLRAGQIGVWSASSQLASPVQAGKPTPADGAAQLAWIDEACDLVSAGVCDALATGPVSKVCIAGSGAPGAKRFRGHTEHLAARVGADEVVMAFVGGGLATALVTTHLPLKRVPRAITAVGVGTTCFWLADLLRRIGHARPRIVVAGLNPHAGEGGLLGSEEIDVIAPGVDHARERLRTAKMPATLVGPIGAESAYRLTMQGAFDGVVAMYHDQATIAGKLVGFGEMVNVTLGMPIVRTSVDHGTAYDRAGSGSASASGMAAALSLAIRLVSV